MKTPEDEAFDDLARKQGAWGGGFTAKRKMAAHKLEGDVDAFERWWYYEGSVSPYTHHDCEEHTKRMCQIAWSNGAYVAAQPAQEQRQWVGLTEEDFSAINQSCFTKFQAATSAESILKGKNL